MKSKWILLLPLCATLLLNACVVVPYQPGYGYTAGPPVVVAPAYVRGYGYYGYGHYGHRHW